MALSPDEVRVFDALSRRLSATQAMDDLHDAYYEGEQRLEQMGLAVPPELQRFLTIVDWPALVVDTVAERIQLKGFILPGEDQSDDVLAEGWEASNMDSDQHMLWNDKLVYGRGFVSVGSNEDDPDHPIIAVESPRETTVWVDTRRRRVLAALKLYRSDPLNDVTLQPDQATLYMPNRTTWLALDGGRWVDVDRDDHNLGRVPVVPFLNRRRTGKLTGVSEMKRAISLTDAAARALTNLQLAQETHSVPQRWFLGMKKEDFVDQNGKPIPLWKAYFSGIWSSESESAKAGQFAASDLRNFTETINFYGSKIAGLYGLPPQYVGVASANPSSAAAIREAKEGLIMRAEMHMSHDGDALGRVMDLYTRFRTGEWSDGDRIKALWMDPSTPTLAARADAVQKLNGGRPVLSLEGSWDELDWSEPRKARERQYFAAEANSDPAQERLIRAIEGSSGGDANADLG